jgi:YidC/Oxa1 family membrane protein insertase
VQTVGSLRDSVIGLFETILTFFHDLFEPIFGLHSWGWSIIALTVVVRVLLLPLAIKQTRSMRAMQALQPQLKELQRKYKVDRELMRKDPEQYRAKRQKLNEEMMELYKREGANPAASCLPLLAQAPVFIALFWTLRWMDELVGQPFYFFTSVADGGLEATVSQAGWPGWLLILLMSGTMFWSQKQMMARNAATQADNPMAQQQKMLLYVMPVFLAVISFQFPLGILLYWVTTNFWQVAQQWIILREVTQAADTSPPGDSESPRRSPGASSGRGKGASSGRDSSAPADAGDTDASSGAKAPDGDGRPDPGAKKPAKKPKPEDPDDPRASNGPASAQERPAPGPSDHLPRRRRRGDH